MSGMFPYVIIEIIADYSALPHLLEWIPRNKLDMDLVMHQILSFDAGLHGPEYVNIGKPEYIVKVSCGFMDVTRRIGDTYHPLSWTCTWSDPDLLDQLLENPLISKKHISWSGLCMNPNPMAVDLVLKNLHEKGVVMNCLSRNPAMMPLLIKYSEFVDHETLWTNPHEMVIEYISKIHESLYNWHFLSQNPHPWVINKLRENQNNIMWTCLSSNPGIFEYRRVPDVIKGLLNLRW